MHKFSQASGLFTLADGTTAQAYSGAGAGKDNPAMQSVKDLGPLPIGLYSIEPPRDTDSHGPYVLPLVPDASNEMYGRAGFLIHGDSVKVPGTASHGCIILPRATREVVWDSGDHALAVVT